MRPRDARVKVCVCVKVTHAFPFFTRSKPTTTTTTTLSPRVHPTADATILAQNSGRAARRTFTNVRRRWQRRRLCWRRLCWQWRCWWWWPRVDRAPVEQRRKHRLLRTEHVQWVGCGASRRCLGSCRGFRREGGQELRFCRFRFWRFRFWRFQCWWGSGAVWCHEGVDQSRQRFNACFRALHARHQRRHRVR